jgi:cholesterol transport system auxiliary component
MRLHLHIDAMKRLGRGTMRLKLKNYLAAVLLCVGLAAATAGCGSTRPVKYYQLTYPPAPGPASQESFNTAILVRLFQTSHLYREDRIVYGNDTPEMGTYEDHRWAEPPSEMLQDALVRGLRRSGRFTAVTTLRSDSKGEFILTGHLYEFKEVSGGPIAARLNFDAQLRELKTGRTVWTFSYTHDEPASGKEVESVVAAMDKNVQLSVQAVLGGVSQYFTDHPVNQ